jgi:diguanylate cyclase (GGDEF)-like protein
LEHAAAAHPRPACAALPPSEKATAVKSPAERPDSFVLAPFDCEFRDAATETAFLSQHLGETQAQLRAALGLGVFFFVAFGVTDIARAGYGHDTVLTLSARLLVAIAAAAGLAVTYLRPRSILLTRLVPSAVEALAMLVSLFIVMRRPAEMPWHALSLTIVLIVTYVYIPNRPRHAVAVAVPATLAFLGLAHRHGAMQAVDFMTMTILLMLTNIFGAVAMRRYQRLWREEFRAQTILKNLAVRDPLTGCYNRRHLHEQLMENEIARAHRYGLCLSVVMCDLDHFKTINDTHGHYGGDAVLCAFAALLLGTTRHGIDHVVRFGGEEFLLILPETDLVGAMLLAERLRKACVEMAVPHESTPAATPIAGVTASFGVASRDFAIAGAVPTQYDMIASADELLYAAKHGGRNQVRALLLN